MRKKAFFTLKNNCQTDTRITSITFAVRNISTSILCFPKEYVAVQTELTQRTPVASSTVCSDLFLFCVQLGGSTLISRGYARKLFDVFGSSLSSAMQGIVPEKGFHIFSASLTV